MNRNDACFCGSGLKYKKCHRDINSESYFAKLMSLYKDLDNKIKDGCPNVKCKKGCTECCYQQFDISPVEFAYIFDVLYSKDKVYALELLKKGKSQWLLYKEKFPDKAAFIEETKEGSGMDAALDFVSKYAKNNPIREDNDFPCIFLEDNQCSIYDIRPYVCRHYGVTIPDGYVPFNKLVFCSHTEDGVHPFDLVAASDLDTTFLAKMYSKTLNYTALNKPYPFLYHCKLYHDNLENSILKIRELKSLSIEAVSTNKILRALNRING